MFSFVKLPYSLEGDCKKSNTSLIQNNENKLLKIEGNFREKQYKILYNQNSLSFGVNFKEIKIAEIVSVKPYIYVTLPKVMPLTVEFY